MKNAFCGGRRQRENETSGETKEFETIVYPFADTQNPRARPAMENGTLRQQKPQEELVSSLIK